MPLGKMDIGTQRNDSLPRNRLERPDEATLEMACAGVSSRPPTLMGKRYMLTVIPVLLPMAGGMAPERPGLGYSHMKRGSENNGDVIVWGQPPWQRKSSMDLNTTFCHNQMEMEG
jgi:hypothetical protein